MAFDTGKLQELFKDKRVLIGAAVIGGIAGLYVLSKSGGNGGLGVGAGAGAPVTPPASDTGDGGSSDTAGLAGQIAEIQANQGNFQSQIQAALQALQDGFSSALGNAQSQNQSALQSVIDQVNGQLSSGSMQTGTASVPDFSAFASQLTQSLGQVQNQAGQINKTGGIFKNTLRVTNSTLNPIPPNILVNINTRAPNYAGRGIIGTIKSIVPPSSTFQRFGSYTKTSVNSAVPKGASISNYVKPIKLPKTVRTSIIPRRGGGSTFR